MGLLLILPWRLGKEAFFLFTACGRRKGKCDSLSELPQLQLTTMSHITLHLLSRDLC